MKTKVMEKPIGILTLAQQIGALHRDIEGRSEEMYSLLTRAREDVGPGGWMKWLADNEEVLGFGERQARRYLREPDVRTADQAQEAKRQRGRRAAVKKSKPKLTPAERLAIKNETAVLNPITGKVVKLTPAELLAIKNGTAAINTHTGKVISLVHYCGVPGCGQPFFTTSTTGCDHLLCETHGADISCDRNEAQVCPVCAPDAPEQLADVAAGRTSATKVLQESKPKPTQGLEAEEAAGSYLGELVKLSSSIISQIKETVKARHGVSTKDHEAAAQAVEKLREALATIAPVWKCEECSDVLEPGREPDSRYECGECGDDTLKENRCGSCNKFAMKVSDTACEMEGCSGEMVLVGWETAIDLIAAQKKKEADEERRSSAEWAAAKEFAKTKAGKAEAAKRAAEDKAEDAARLKKDEDRTLELARLIAKGRSEGKTTEQVKRKEEKATRAEIKARWAAQEAAPVIADELEVVLDPDQQQDEVAGDQGAAEPEPEP